MTYSVSLTCLGEFESVEPLASSPTLTILPVKTTLIGLSSGSLHQCRVRVLGAKGPGPWSTTIIIARAG